MDLGASRHIATNPQKIKQLTNLDLSSSDMKTGEGESHVIRGIRISTIKTDLETIKLDYVKYVLSMTKNLISVGSITDTRSLVIFDKFNCWILDRHDHTQIIASGKKTFQMDFIALVQIFKLYQQLITIIKLYGIDT